ncbi:DNA-dependent RNA polymerase, partial [Sphaeroforma arctica JP610]
NCRTDVGPKSKVNVQRQKSAFPPNFVHSLDATHMLITATMCSKKNILFASVHDSYWTHAGSVEDMNILIRDAFVELHRQPILDQLLQFWKAHYGGLNMIQGARAKKVKLLPLPKRGIIDLEKVKNSPYFFD